MSTSTSAPSSSSSSSSSSQGEKELSSLEAFELFFEKLTLKNSTFFVEDYIEEKMIGDEILFNQYSTTMKLMKRTTLLLVIAKRLIKTQRFQNSSKRHMISII